MQGPNSHWVSRSRQEKENSTERAKSILLIYSVYLHGDEGIKEENKNPQNSDGENIFKDSRSESLTQKLLTAHSTTTWLENRGPEDEPEGKM